MNIGVGEKVQAVIPPEFAKAFASKMTNVSSS